MNKPVFLLVEATPNIEEQESMMSYLSKAPIVTKEHGGVTVATYDVEKSLNENDNATIYSIISFPNQQEIKALFNSPAYKALVAERDRGFSYLRYHIVNERI